MHPQPATPRSFYAIGMEEKSYLSTPIYEVKFNETDKGAWPNDFTDQVGGWIADNSIQYLLYDWRRLIAIFMKEEDAVMCVLKFSKLAS